MSCTSWSALKADDELLEMCESSLGSGEALSVIMILDIAQCFKTFDWMTRLCSLVWFVVVLAKLNTICLLDWNYAIECPGYAASMWKLCDADLVEFSFISLALFVIASRMSVFQMPVT